MIEPTTDRGRRLAALSQRLRMLHTELAEQSAEMRVEQLRDEVQRAVASLPPQEREGFLADLAEQFPMWSAANGAAPKAAPAVAAAPVAMDPKSLAEKLIELGRTMSQAEKDAVTARLSAGGFSTVVKEVVRESSGGGGAAFPPAALAEFRKAVGLPADGEVNPGRLLELSALLVEFTLKIEPWACSYWRDLAPDAKNAIYQTLNKEFPRYVSGDDKITKEGMHKSVYKLRSLVSLLMKGVMEAGKQFARDHMSRYSMEAVRESAPKETFKSDEYRCWKQYERLMEGVDAPAIEKRIKQLIAKDVDTGLSQVIR